jgi:hypothetical protein
MTLRRIIALLVFLVALYLGLKGIFALSAAGTDGYALLIGAFYCGWGIGGTLVAAALAFGMPRKRPRPVPRKTSRAHDVTIGLFMAFFGLGCLYVAGNGLFTGSVAGLSRRSGDVALSAGVLPFLFLVLLWAGLGSGLVYLSVRVFRGDDRQE